MLGFPHEDTPDPLSREKFSGTYTHRRKTLGHLVDSRTMTVGIAPEKMEILLEELCKWINVVKEFTLREISSLHGSLESITRFTMWARPYFFSTQNEIRRTLEQRYFILKRTYKAKEREAAVRQELTPQLMHRLGSLIAKEKAMFLWSNNAKISIDEKATRKPYDHTRRSTRRC